MVQKRPNFLVHNGFVIQPFRVGARSPGWQTRIIPQSNAKVGSDGQVAAVDPGLLIVDRGPGGEEHPRGYPNRGDAVRYAQYSINSSNFFLVSYDGGKTWKMRELTSFSPFWFMSGEFRNNEAIRELITRIKSGEQIEMKLRSGLVVTVRAFVLVQ